MDNEFTAVDNWLAKFPEIDNHFNATAPRKQAGPAAPKPEVAIDNEYKKFAKLDLSNM